MLAARGQAEPYARALPASEGRPPFVIVVGARYNNRRLTIFTTNYTDARRHPAEERLEVASACASGVASTRCAKQL